MRIIKTQQDLVVLRLAVTLPVELLLQVEEYLLQLRDAQKEKEATEFRLVGRGYIVVLEAGDNIRDLGNMGLDHENGGLLGSHPEYVEILDVGDGLQTYKVAILYDNDYLMTFFTQAGAHDEEVEKYIPLAPGQVNPPFPLLPIHILTLFFILLGSFLHTKKLTPFSTSGISLLSVVKFVKCVLRVTVCDPSPKK